MVESGIYYVKGDYILIQIVVTRRLSENENLWLKSLTNNLNKIESTEKLVEDHLENKENNLYHSVIEIITHTNQKIFEEVNGISDIFMKIVKDKFDRKLNEQLDEKFYERLKVELERTTEQVTQEEVTHRTKLLDCITLVNTTLQLSNICTLLLKPLFCGINTPY